MRRFGLGFAVAGAIYGAAEIAIRVVNGPPPPAMAVFGIVPVDDHFLDLRGAALVPKFQLAPPDAEFPVWPTQPRIAVIGGSTVHFGDAQVPIQREFPALLEEALGVDVINLGSPGLDSNDHVRLMGELVQYEWSAIVVVAGHNDFGNAFFLNRYAGVEGWMVAHTSQWLGRSAVYSLLRRNLVGARGGANLILRGNENNDALSGAQQAAITNALVQNITRMAWLAERADIPFYAVVPPVDWIRPPIRGSCPVAPCAARMFRDANAKQRAHDPAAPAAFRAAGDADGILLHITASAQDALREADFGAAFLVDAESELPREPTLDLPASVLFADSVHFTGQGHAAMATLLAKHLRETGSFSGRTGNPRPDE